MSRTDIALITISVIVAANWLVTLAIVRRLNQNGAPKRTPQMGLQTGMPVPDFTARRLDDAEVTLADFARRRAVFVFVSPGCTACKEGVSEYVRISTVVKRRGEVFELVSDGTRDETVTMLGQAAENLDVMLAPQPTNSLFAEFKVNATPLFTVFEDGKVVSSGLAWETIPAWKVLSNASITGLPTERGAATGARIT